jgi:hypothetical protein
VFGGMIAYWGEEGAALQDSNPKFGRVVLDAKKLTGLSAVPNELLQDSIVSFSALIERCGRPRSRSPRTTRSSPAPAPASPSASAAPATRPRSP